jgi:hypothetical protein
MADSLPSNVDLRNLIEELHKHMRHDMLLWVQWFTFFVSINYLAFGWFAGSDANKLPSQHALWIASCLFISQCGLGVWVSLFFRNWLTNADRELFGLYAALNAQANEPTFSLPFYRLALALGTAALLVLIAGWIALAVWLR